ncbi:ABC transporter ATP-binding protein [Uliginosibacterium sp. TH139]|uniref:ABC transporter ATP-binding protein n=1 Tax=Uliginosibacterium sp. TH139 TaxID=2067453 RepID=UPI000C7A57C9|nr:ABC transporter ATP-binding protein [Uliginosibacterium sp. TH139]PLK49131.1 ABC transporter ATP-binding protein [Uliginosibacterium sp. TH139]
MSSDKTEEFAIEVNDLSKCYPIFSRPSDRLKQLLIRGRKRYYKEFWALNGISFTIRRGETVGIIGRNGSGKSTLLQMICGTLNPTAGEIRVNGRVAALLELGAGFNPEFSGVENVYMAASLYGLSKEEVDQRFAAIANFADIGDYIHQPVKTYSSGMYVRLAFAVIAHVDADILVVDEALAVGDAVFTQKCMRFIRAFKEKGTLLFVSHDMASVRNLCERAMWLDCGGVRLQGTAKDVSEEYLKYTLQQVYGENIKLQTIDVEKERQLSGCVEAQVIEGRSSIDYRGELSVENNLCAANGWKTGAGELTHVEFGLADPRKILSGPLAGGELVKVGIHAVAHQDLERPILGFIVRDKLGQDLFGENTLSFTQRNPLRFNAGGHFKAEFVFRLPMLPNGDYSVMVSLADGDLVNHVQHHWLHDAIILKVSSSDVRWGLVGAEIKGIELRAL